MIKIIEIAEELKSALNSMINNKIIDKFQIFVRINNCLDVYTSLCENKEWEDLEKHEIDEEIRCHLEKINKRNNDYFKKYRIQWYNYMSSDYENDILLKRISKDFHNDINKNNRFRFNSILSDNKEEIQLNKNFSDIPIITFYSYKGGMGRTTTLMSYAIDLAINKKKKVLILDCDLEAPGYLSFFNLDKHSDLNSGKTNGFVEFLNDINFCENNDDVDIDNYWINVVYGNDTLADYDLTGLENIRLMPAGNLNRKPDIEDDDNYILLNQTHYLEGLSRLNFSNKNALLSGFNQLIKKAKDSFEPDVILIDSRTGFNDIIGTISISISKMVVAFLGFNAQTRPGSLFISNMLKDQDKELVVVNSILSKEYDYKDELRSMTNLFGDNGSIPNMFQLHRNCVLERIGQYNISDKQDAGMKDLIDLIKNSKNDNCEKNGGNEDYYDLFSYINESLKIHDDIEEIFEEKEFSYINESLKIDYNIKEIFEEKAICSYIKSLKIHNDIEEIFKEKEITYEFKNEEIEDVLNTKKNNPAIEKIRSGKASALQLRNYVLSGIEQNLRHLTVFAEDATISERMFFYRECMNELFKKEKFIIQGYKGTGKTYLYKSLANPKTQDIAANIKERARKKLGEDAIPEDVDQIFIDVISRGDDEGKEKDFDFKLALKEKKDKLDSFDESFWKIHTWNSLLLHEEFDFIRRESELSNYISPIKGSKSVSKFFELIEMGLKVQVTIDDDFKKIDEYLLANKKQLFLLYDQLDTKINPTKWGNVVSPLISYWRENYTQYQSIFPKIFVRTDLLKQIKGTNTARLESNKISIEWTMEEIFSYFFKLLFSNETAKEAFWQLAVNKAQKINLQEKETVEKELRENNNQFKTLNYSSMKRFVNVVFEKVKYESHLKDPWKYFTQELSNAEGQVCLRPFINMLTTEGRNGNVISQAKKSTKRYVKCIIESEIYANKDIRIYASKQYFDDLCQDEFSIGLMYFGNYLESSEGKEYRKKVLKESELDSLLENVFYKYKDKFQETVENKDDLRRLLEANGIIAMRPGRGRKDYEFAPMYIYLWQLKNIIV